LLTRAPEGTVEDAITVGGIREWRYAVNRAHEASFLWSSIRRSLALFDRLRRTEPMDAVIIHQAVAGLGPLFARRHAATRWLYVCHSLAHEEYDTRRGADRGTAATLRRRFNGHARRWIERAVITRCERVVVLSDFMRRRVMAVHGIPSERIVVIPGATDPQAFLPATDRSAVRRSLGLPADRTLLFTVRNLVPRMGLENLLDGMAASGLARRRGLLVIGGEGPLRPALAAGIRKRGLDHLVRLVGFVPEAQLAAYYQAADLVVMPSLQLEGFGLVTVEAMACGTPVMGTPIGALPEILNQVDPILVAEGTDGGSLARALDRVLARIDEPGEYGRWSQAGRRLIERRYNWASHCADLAALLGRESQARRAA
jgi:glycosyltransferase involved in cell wall biosynthesis